MVNEGLKIENNNHSSDRRQICAPIHCDRRCGHDRRSSFREKLHEEKGLVYALESLPPVRRLVTLPDKIEDGELTSALGMAGLAFINLPEDWRDIKNAIGQIRAHSKGDMHVGAYMYEGFEKEFSFLRGTLIEHLVDFSKAHKHPELGKLLEADKSLVRTGLGHKILSLFGVDFDKKEEIKTFNTKTKSWEVAKDYKGNVRYANSFKGGGVFGNITARALSRTTLFGTIIIAALELPKIFKSVSKGNTVEEKASNTVEQVAKSGINVAATTVGIAYGGAIGSKYGKAFGSLVGMGVGAIVGATASQKIQDML